MIATLGADATGEKPAAVLEAAGLRAVFVRRGDRFAHRIEVRDDAVNSWAIALESREGTDEEPWRILRGGCCAGSRRLDLPSGSRCLLLQR